MSTEDQVMFFLWEVMFTDYQVVCFVGSHV